MYETMEVCCICSHVWYAPLLRALEHCMCITTIKLGTRARLILVAPEGATRMLSTTGQVGSSFCMQPLHCFVLGDTPAVPAISVCMGCGARAAFMPTLRAARLRRAVGPCHIERAPRSVNL